MFWEQVSAWFVGVSYDGVQFAAVVLLQSTVLTGPGLAAGRLVRRKGAALESAVYRTTLAAVILCPAASLLLQRAGVEGFVVVLPRFISPPENALEVDSPVRTEVPPAEPVWDGDSAAMILPSEVAAVEDRPAAVGRTVRARPLAPLVPDGHESAAGPAAVSSAQTPAMPTPAGTSKWDATGLGTCLMWAAWLLASCFLLLRLLAAQLGIMHLRRTACEAGPATLAQCRAVAGRLGVRPPAVRRSPFVTSPCLVGLFRPTILLAESEPPDGNSDREVLVHELAHLARCDHVWNLLGRLSVAALFFQPLLWFLLRRIVRTAEEVCDDYVVDFGLDRRDYARRLTEIAEGFLPRGLAAGVGMISLKSLLGRRIVRILDGAREPSVRVGLRSAAATLLVGCLGTLMVALLAVRGDPAHAATEGETTEKSVSADTADSEDADPAAVEGGTAEAEEKPADEAAPRRAVDLAPPVRITAGGKPIDVPGFAAPFVCDFDEDGRNDLLVGQLDHGRLRIYRNTGSNARPKFDGFEWFTAGGQIASIPAGCVVGFTPQLVDFDGDGRTDIVTGSFAWGLLYVFRRNADGTFAEAEVLEDKDGELQMRNYSFENRRIEYNLTVFVHDWDGDGDGDLLLGPGHRGLILNEGTRRQPVFAAPVPITLDGKPIPSGCVPPCVADWDGDGRDDLLIGRGQDIVWYRNVGKKGRPVLQPPEILVFADDRVHYDDDRPDDQRRRPERHAYSICAADFNADGRLDLLLGDHYYNRRTLTEEQNAQFTEASKKRSAFHGKYRRMIRERPENETRQERVERFRKALREFRGLSAVPWVGAQASQRRMERHGGVWLYERVALQGGRR